MFLGFVRFRLIGKSNKIILCPIGKWSVLDSMPLWGGRKFYSSVEASEVDWGKQKKKTKSCRTVTGTHAEPCSLFERTTSVWLLPNQRTSIRNHWQLVEKNIKEKEKEEMLAWVKWQWMRSGDVPERQHQELRCVVQGWGKEGTGKFDSMT